MDDALAVQVGHGVNELQHVELCLGLWQGAVGDDIEQFAPGGDIHDEEELGVTLDSFDEADDIRMGEFSKHGSLPARVLGHFHVLQTVLPHDLDSVLTAGIVIDGKHNLGEHANAELLSKSVATDSAGRHGGGTGTQHAQRARAGKAAGKKRGGTKEQTAVTGTVRLYSGAGREADAVCNIRGGCGCR